jgi:hypothetical protein
MRDVELLASLQSAKVPGPPFFWTTLPLSLALSIFVDPMVERTQTMHSRRYSPANSEGMDRKEVSGSTRW